ncbi:hypothetical protein CFAM422_012055 [Trichoderma lentiforme]|uniref:Uncharacterized protein n=1 Tax=Trichoderma lentiforme TaxID=1567552 RepID=A0A9P5C8P4_9HYPO|nr:hypothetical protein CFAM422_012055 [Trichoderma lentiforme]
MPKNRIAGQPGNRDRKGHEEETRCKWAEFNLLEEGRHQQPSGNYRLVESGGEDGEDAGEEATEEGISGF